VTRTADILVIGAGMAGASAAAELSAAAKVLLLESEERPGFHSTGRSAAIFIQNYGNAVIRQLSKASRPLFEAHPLAEDGQSFLSDRGLLFLADAESVAGVDELLAEADGLEEIDEARVCRLVPVLRPNSFVRAAYEADAKGIDVDRLHQTYLRALTRNGGEVVCKAGARAIARDGGVWRIETPAGAFEAPVIVDAAGAWADVVAETAGVPRLGLQPRRRSAALVPPREGWDVESWPLTADVAERWYMKPEAGMMMVSPADADPVDPHDAWPDDMVLAEGLDRFCRVFDYEVTKLAGSWAGLRTFAPDKSLVIGFDPAAEGFFWLAGQGGYGIQTAPAAARCAAALALGRDVPAELATLGFTADSVSPARFR
jgi:D-arginine dehydrogenase